jgi:hypothetical protein
VTSIQEIETIASRHMDDDAQRFAPHCSRLPYAPKCLNIAEW